MVKRFEIIAKGKVQKVGYRDYVEEVARSLGIVGFVENLKDGNVRICLLYTSPSPRDS